MSKNKFFNEEEIIEWKKHWKEMPEFIQNDRSPYRSIIVHFRKEEDIKRFEKLINQKITSKTKFIYFPKLIIKNLKKKICIDES